jgi:hypothetical protein
VRPRLVVIDLLPASAWGWEFGGSVPARESTVQWRKRKRCRRGSMEAVKPRRRESEAADSAGPTLPSGLTSAWRLAPAD